MEARNADYARVASDLFGAGGGGGEASSSSSVERLGEEAPPGPLEAHDAVFWVGDFNYRVEANRKAADMLLRENMLEVRR